MSVFYRGLLKHALAFLVSTVFAVVASLFLLIGAVIWTVIIKKAESWIIEETEVDPEGHVVRCVTKNLDHVKALRVEERVTLRATDDQ